jgi:hypothetical protein
LLWPRKVDRGREGDVDQSGLSSTRHRARSPDAALTAAACVERWNDRWTLDRVRVSNGDGVTGLAAHLRALGLPS